MKHTKVLRVKVKVKDGYTKPDIEIIQGLDYNCPNLEKGDTEVEVTINANDDTKFTDKPVSIAQFNTNIAKIKSASSFIREEPLEKAKSAEYSNKGVTQ